MKKIKSDKLLEGIALSELILKSKDELDQFKNDKFTKRASTEYQSLLLMFLSDERSFTIKNKETNFKILLDDFIQNCSPELNDYLIVTIFNYNLIF